MGLQETSERKVRKASSETGLPLIRAMRHSNNLWFGWVREGEGHWHVGIDPSTWEWGYLPGCGFSSCPAGTYGPGVLPPPDVLEKYERQEREWAEVQEQKDAAAAEFIATWTEETRKWLESKGVA